MRILTPEETREFLDKLNDSKWAESVGRIIASAVARGSTIVIDGREVKCDDQEDGA